MPSAHDRGRRRTGGHHGRLPAALRPMGIRVVATVTRRCRTRKRVAGRSFPYGRSQIAQQASGPTDLVSPVARAATRSRSTPPTWPATRRARSVLRGWRWS